MRSPPDPANARPVDVLRAISSPESQKRILTILMPRGGRRPNGSERFGKPLTLKRSSRSR